MKHGSLFSGIGGFDLAAEWMGWENVFHCEWMEFPRKVLDYYFPNADSTYRYM
jgi:DNA (cytosine-5)-methyltransferase 1